MTCKDRACVDYEKEITMLHQDLDELNEKVHYFMSECERLKNDNEKLYTKIVAYENVIKWQVGIGSRNDR